jgi:hypothetical protein
MFELSGCNYTVVETWTYPTSEVVQLNQTVTSTLCGDSLCLTVNGTWSGTEPTEPDGTTFTILPYTEEWEQIGPGHVRMTYQETYEIDGVPRTVQVQKDFTYAGSAELTKQQSRHCSNIVVTHNAITNTKHYESDNSFGVFVPAMGPAALAGAVGLLLLTGGWLTYRTRRRAPGAEMSS